MNNKFEALGTVSLYGATINASLICSEGFFKNTLDKYALFAQNIKVGDSVFLNEKFYASATVSLYGANIGDNLDCSNGQFNSNIDIYALFIQSIKVRNCVFLNKGFIANGKVNLYGATIGRDLICSNGTFISKGEDEALFANSVKVTGSVFLDKKFRAEGKVSLYSATIRGNLDCTGGKFTNKQDFALFADSINVTGSVLLKESNVNGKVSLYHATIKSELDCTKSTFRSVNKVNGELNVAPEIAECEKNHALIAEFVHVIGSVMLKDVKVYGKFSLYSANITGDLLCENTRFKNENGNALMAEFINVKGSILLKKVKSQGKVNLYGATIGNNLDCNDGLYINKNKGDKAALFAESINVGGSIFLSEFKVAGSVSFSFARIDKTLQIKNIRKLKEMVLDLQFSKCQTLELIDLADPLSFVELNGLVFESLGKKIGEKFEDYIESLQKIPSLHISSQPYEQLAKVLRASGQEKKAKDVLIKKENDQLSSGNLSFFKKLWRRFLGWTIGYGYHPERAFLFALIVVLFGSCLFGTAHQYKLITPTDKDCTPSNLQQKEDCYNELNYPQFDPVIYSLDTFLPIMDLQFKKYWQPNDKSAKWLRYYLFVHIVLGWVLTTLWIAAFTGIIRSNNKSQLEDLCSELYT